MSVWIIILLILAGLSFVGAIMGADLWKQK
jgi:hypothetical protein